MHSISFLRETSAIFTTLRVESLPPKPEDQASGAQVRGDSPHTVGQEGQHGLCRHPLS